MALITKEQVKTELTIEGTSADTIIDSLIDRIQSLWDTETNRTWEQTTFTEYYSSEESDTVFLKNYPVSSITTIHDDPDWVYGSDTLVSSDDYTYDEKDGIVYYNGDFFTGRNNIKVVYVAGYLTTPGWLEQILIRQVAHWYTQGTKQKWDKSSNSMQEGGTTSYTQLKNNMLPDFDSLVEMHRRPSI